MIWFTTEQLASRWEMSPGTLRNWRCQGVGPVFYRETKRGRPIIYHIRDIKKWESRLKQLKKRQSDLLDSSRTLGVRIAMRSRRFA